MDSVDLASLVTPIGTDDPTRFTLDVIDGMQQGRGAWGGIATGAIVAAAQMVDPRPEMAVRNLTAQLVAPVLVGRVEIVVAELRRGSATNTLAARVLDSAGEVLAHGVVVLGAARRGDAMPDGAAWRTATPPAALATDPEAAPVIAIGPPLAPDFAVHLEWRPLCGLPYSGSPGETTEGWIRPRAPLSRVDASVVAALADAWWVAVMSRMDRPRPAATVGFTLDLPGDPTTLPIRADGQLEALFHRGRVVAAREGFVVETRELWSRAGELVSWNTQTVAVIR